MTADCCAPCPFPCHTATGAGRAERGGTIAPPPAGPITVQRRVSQRCSSVAATQRTHVGMIHARKIVTVTDYSFQITTDGDGVATVPRTTACEVRR
jgi:hypothetical protein